MKADEGFGLVLKVGTPVKPVWTLKRNDALVLPHQQRP